MGLRIVSKTIAWLQQLDSRMLWLGPTGTAANDRKVYLTFDDGPIPEVTPWVLDTLKKYGIKASFFCIGQNIEKNPELFQRMRDEGHAIGNHTWDHPSGWKTSARAYYRTVLRCQQLTRTDMFRPPYGRITNRQINALRKRYQLIMWDVLSGDFEQHMSGEEVARVVLGSSKPGSIIVFHDNLLSQERMRYAMPHVVEQLLKQGYEFALLPYKPV